MAKTLDEDFPMLEKAALRPVGVLKKLMQARIDLQSRKLSKSGHNKFAGYFYFELGDFLPVVQEIFNNLGLCGVISYGRDEAWLTITDTEDGSSTAVCSPMSTAALKGCHEVQNLGAVQTYIRRYLWVTAMEIVEHDALDATTGQEQKASHKSEAKSEWDKLDAETQNWMTDEAMAITVMLKDSDIAGAYNHLESLKLEADYKIAFWSRLDASQRSAIKAYSSIINAKTVDALANAWAAVPNRYTEALWDVKNKRAAELT